MEEEEEKGEEEAEGDRHGWSSADDLGRALHRNACQSVPLIDNSTPFAELSVSECPILPLDFKVCVVGCLEFYFILFSRYNFFSNQMFFFSLK